MDHILDLRDIDGLAVYKTQQSKFIARKDMWIAAVIMRWKAMRGCQYTVGCGLDSDSPEMPQLHGLSHKH